MTSRKASNCVRGYHYLRRGVNHFWWGVKLVNVLSTLVFAGLFHSIPSRDLTINHLPHAG